jgi:DNA-binding XRE family transcriptional regulator
MANRKHSVCHLRRRRHYNVREAARAIGATPGTVRNWEKNGLEAVAGIYPTIFRGVDIIEFFARRKRARQQPCGPGRLFCFRCKIPQRPAFDEVEFWPDGPNSGKLRGLCPNCATTMNRRVSIAKLKSATGDLAVSMRCADTRLSETKIPNCNDDSQEV